MIIRVFTTVLFCFCVVGIILFARGYRVNISGTPITSTGLVAVTSTPRSAKVYVNGELKGITDLSLHLAPGTYTFSVIREGYFPWQKTITLQGEVVQSLDAVLYPLNSSLNPLTNIGIVKAVPIGHHSDKILLMTDRIVEPRPSSAIVPTTTSDTEIKEEGIFIYDASQKVVSLLPNLQHILDYDDLGEAIDPLNLEVQFSPDKRQMIIYELDPDRDTTTQDIKYQRTLDYTPQYEVPGSMLNAYYLSLTESESKPVEITSSVSNLISAWTLLKAKDLSALTSSYDKPLDSFLSESGRIIDISLDETKVLYEATKSATLKPVLKQGLIGTNQTSQTRTTLARAIYLYDIKEDKNYQLYTKDEAQGQSDPVIHPNSKNIVVSEPKSIVVSDYDGSNPYSIYSGPMTTEFYYITSDGRVLALINLNPGRHPSPDLYAIGIR